MALTMADFKDNEFWVIHEFIMQNTLNEFISEYMQVKKALDVENFPDSYDNMVDELEKMTDFASEVVINGYMIRE